MYYTFAYFNFFLKIHTSVLDPSGNCLPGIITSHSGSNKVSNAVIMKLHFVNFTLKITSNFCCSLLAADGFSMAHYEEGRMATELDESPPVGQLSN